MSAAAIENIWVRIKMFSSLVQTGCAASRTWKADLEGVWICRESDEATNLRSIFLIVWISLHRMGSLYVKCHNCADWLQDFAISIAVIHHLYSESRRFAAVKSLLSVLCPNGKTMIFVWALEQKSRRGWDETSEQDVMVPWPGVTRAGSQDVPYQRYYHLFRKGELESCVSEAGGIIKISGYERV